MSIHENISVLTFFDMSFLAVWTFFMYQVQLDIFVMRPEGQAKRETKICTESQMERQMEIRAGRQTERQKGTRTKSSEQRLLYPAEPMS